MDAKDLQKSRIASKSANKVFLQSAAIIAKSTNDLDAISDE